MYTTTNGIMKKDVDVVTMTGRVLFHELPDFNSHNVESTSCLVGITRFSPNAV
jgi:hypothetical protein